MIKDLTGKKFGRWTVVGLAEKRRNGKWYRIFWECLCQCGNKKVVASHVLKRGGSKSCGCLKKEGRKILPRGISERNHILRIYKKNAEIRNLSFHLTTEEFSELTHKNCHYCGTKPKKVLYGKGFDGRYVYNGVDRLNSFMGYSTDNCVPCCETCNKAKMQMSENEFVSWIKSVYKNLMNKNALTASSYGIL